MEMGEGSPLRSSPIEFIFEECYTHDDFYRCTCTMHVTARRALGVARPGAASGPVGVAGRSEEAREEEGTAGGVDGRPGRRTMKNVIHRPYLKAL